MKSIVIAFAAIGLTVAGSAAAASHVTDLDYLKASRCKGLATALKSSDAVRLDAFLKAEGRNRNDIILQRADDEAARAKREAANPERKDRLAAELSGPCSAYLSGGSNVSAAS